MSRHPDWPKRWRVWKDRGDWVVSSPEYAERGFHTWQEAMNYADRMARTIEMTLPRVSYGDHVVADRGVYSLHVDHREHCTDITLGGWDGLTVENRHLMDLALYLAACAQHQEARR